MNFSHDHYVRFEELTHFLKETADRFPDLARLSSIGRTAEGRDIWLMTVTDHRDHESLERPAVWVDGNTHATELAGCQACIHLIDFLTARAKQAEVAHLLKRTTFYVVPRISADGAEFVLTQKMFVRSTPQPFPAGEPFENFEIKDLDGDGEILTLRVKDPAGRFKVSQKDPRLMVPREPTDLNGGPYYHLYPEGEFRNYDGFTRRYQDPRRHDLNRQSPSAFNPEEGGAGFLPMTLPEARALAQAVVERPNIVSAINFHTHGGFLLRPSSYKPDVELPTRDLRVYEIMGKIGQKATGYRPLSVFQDFRYDPKRMTTGSWDDWHYDHRGVYAWAPEIWSLAEKAGVHLEKALEIYQTPSPEHLETVFHWCGRNLQWDEFYRDWKPYSHPQLGEVEIGGWKTLMSWSNPPPKYLAEECQKLTNFILDLARLAPQLEVRQVKVEKIGDNLSLLRIQVSNSGFLSTSVSDNAQALKVYDPPVARLKLAPGQELIDGKLERQISHLAGREAAFPWASPVMANRGGHVANSNEEVLTYTVKGPGTVEFEASYHGGGVVRQRLELG